MEVWVRNSDRIANQKVSTKRETKGAKGEEISGKKY